MSVARWAKLFEVDGVQVLIAYRWDDEERVNKVYITLQAAGLEHETSIVLRGELTQAKFDAVANEKLAEASIKSCRDFGFDPLRIQEGAPS